MEYRDTHHFRDEIHFEILALGITESSHCRGGPILHKSAYIELLPK